MYRNKDLERAYDHASVVLETQCFWSEDNKQWPQAAYMDLYTSYSYFAGLTDENGEDIYLDDSEEGKQMLSDFDEAVFLKGQKDKRASEQRAERNSKIYS